jgi:hypothetical protein
MTPYDTDEHSVNSRSAPPRERSAHVSGLGTVRVKGLRCGCGRQVEPRDFAPDADGGVRVICPNCHVALIEVEMDSDMGEVAHED